MSIIRIALRFVAALGIVFVLASTMVLWLPFLGIHLNFRSLGYIETHDPGYTEYAYTYEALRNLSPREERLVLDEIAGELKQKANAELYLMKAYDDPCESDVLSCYGLTSAKVKPFIDAILSDRQTRQAAAYAHFANWISAGSLFVSFVALLFAGMTFFRRRRE